MFVTAATGLRDGFRPFSDPPHPSEFDMHIWHQTAPDIWPSMDWYR